MINTQYGNYVKFIRGTEASWKRIPDANKSSDTLYFITDTNSASGKLYLGAKLIANGNLTSATSLTQLNDVLITEGITDQSILVYNSSTEIWENKSIIDIFLSINKAVVGATDELDGSLGLVPAPIKGQQNLFLKGDGTWANPVTEVVNSLQEIQSRIDTIVGSDEGLSIRDIAQEEASTAVANIIDGAPDAFDTFKEIADWIQTNPGTADVVVLQNKVATLENIIHGVAADEEAGTPAVPGLQAVVSTLQKNVSDMGETVATHTTEITEIKESLRWQDSIE